jgi:hypothetical protein
MFVVAWYVHVRFGPKSHVTVYVALALVAPLPEERIWPSSFADIDTGFNALRTSSSRGFAAAALSVVAAAAAASPREKALRKVLSVPSGLGAAAPHPAPSQATQRRGKSASRVLDRV